MLIRSAAQVSPRPLQGAVSAVLDSISQDFLRQAVNTLAEPRHFSAEADANRRAGQWVYQQLEHYGYDTRYQGRYRNIVAVSPGAADQALLLLGAHYDSVPGSPGADDNASAVAALLACAQAWRRHAPQQGLCCVAFNREEDGLLGSLDFARECLAPGGLRLRGAHILEMLGYCDPRPGSQAGPAGLPVRLPQCGDFISVVGNRISHELVDQVLATARAHLPELPVYGLKVYLGAERYFGHLRRSDHAPLWDAGVPALMWTDTAEFRNPHYHQASDTADTLDYAFLQQVTRLVALQGLVDDAPCDDLK